MKTTLIALAAFFLGFGLVAGAVSQTQFLYHAYLHGGL
jgi:hypothetical protein